MPKIIDLTGKRFGRLTVIERVENDKHGKARWRCHCDCGKETFVVTSDLTTGSQKSCGCSRKGINSSHTMSYSKTYTTWQNVKDRCFNPNKKEYPYYGGRGITVFSDWIHDFQAFYNYVSKLEHFEEAGYTLDRIDNNGNYEPDNLRWADKKTQNRNTRRNHFVQYNGETMTVAEASEKSNIKVNTLLRRIKAGDNGEYLFRPVKEVKAQNQTSSTYT